MGEIRNLYSERLVLGDNGIFLKNWIVNDRLGLEVFILEWMVVGGFRGSLRIKILGLRIGVLVFIYLYLEV